MLVEVIRKHPFKGRTKHPGDRYEMNTAEFKLFSALGHVRECVHENPNPDPKQVRVAKAKLPKNPRYQRRDMRAAK